jgi:hypothetical protein
MHAAEEVNRGVWAFDDPQGRVASTLSVWLNGDWGWSLGWGLDGATDDNKGKQYEGEDQAQFAHNTSP